MQRVPENVNLSRKTGANPSDVVQIRRYAQQGVSITQIADAMRLPYDCVASFVAVDFPDYKGLPKTASEGTGEGTGEGTDEGNGVDPTA